MLGILGRLEEFTRITPWQSAFIWYSKNLHFPSEYCAEIWSNCAGGRWSEKTGGMRKIPKRSDQIHRVCEGAKWKRQKVGKHNKKGELLIAITRILIVAGWERSQRQMIEEKEKKKAKWDARGDDSSWSHCMATRNLKINSRLRISPSLNFLCRKTFCIFLQILKQHLHRCSHTH